MAQTLFAAPVRGGNNIVCRPHLLEDFIGPAKLGMHRLSLNWKKDEDVVALLEFPMSCLFVVPVLALCFGLLYTVGGYLRLLE